MWQRGQLQARAGESWPPTIHSMCGLLDLKLKKRLDRTQHLPAVVIVVLLSVDIAIHVAVATVAGRVCARIGA